MKKARGTKLPAEVQQREDAADIEVFELEMEDVVRLRSDPRGRVRYPPPISAPSAVIGSDDRVDEGGDEAFTAPGVDRRVIRKLKRGEYPAGDRCDLHGMTAADACATVKQFIESSRHGRHRCICIVHGRGLHSESKISILRVRVRKYLRANRSVLAYADAPRSDGGAGAVYVLLRNR